MLSNHRHALPQCRAEDSFFDRVRGRSKCRPPDPGAPAAGGQTTVEDTVHNLCVAGIEPKNARQPGKTPSFPDRMTLSCRRPAWAYTVGPRSRFDSAEFTP